jgi:hypothetical protein
MFDLFSSLNITPVTKSRRMRWTGRVACTGYRGDAYRVLLGKPEGKRPLVRSRHRGEDNIKLVL